MRKVQVIILSTIFIFLFCFNSATDTYAANSISIYINSSKVETDQPPIIEDGRVLVPIRPIAEKLGLNVEFKKETNSIMITKDESVILLNVDSNLAIVNDKPVTLDIPAKIIAGRTMVPIRFIGETFGMEVDWNSQGNTVSLLAYEYVLEKAVLSNDIDLARKCLNSGANPNSGKYAIPLLSYCDSTEMLKLLISYNLDVNAVRHSIQTDMMG